MSYFVLILGDTDDNFSTLNLLFLVNLKNLDFLLNEESPNLTSPISPINCSTFILRSTNEISPDGEGLSKKLMISSVAKPDFKAT